jgi:hypothetical protein
MWVLLELPRFGGAIHANDHDNRSRYREVGLSGPRDVKGLGGRTARNAGPVAGVLELFVPPKILKTPSQPIRPIIGRTTGRFPICPARPITRATQRLV